MDTVTEEKMVASHRAFGGAGDFTRDERTPVKEALTNQRLWRTIKSDQSYADQTLRAVKSMNSLHRFPVVV